MTGYNVIIIDLLKNEVTTKLPDAEKITIIKKNSSNGKISLKAGDVFKLTMKRLDGESFLIQLLHNMKSLIKLSVRNDLLVYAKLVAECKEAAMNGKWGIYYSKPNEHDNLSQAVKDIKDIGSLVGSYLKVKDLNSDATKCVVVITDADPQSNLVVINTNEFEFFDNLIGLQLDGLKPFNSAMKVKGGYDDQTAWKKNTLQSEVYVFELRTDLVKHLPTCQYNIELRCNSINNPELVNANSIHHPRMHITSAREDFLEKSYQYISSRIASLNSAFNHIYNQGLLFLPTKLDKRHLDVPNLSYNNSESQIAVQLPCINVKEIQNQKLIGAHFLGEESIPVKSKHLDGDSILHSLVSYYAMAHSDNPNILPFSEKIFPKLKGILRMSFDAKIRKYFDEMFEIFCLCFDLKTFHPTIQYTSNKIMKSSLSLSKNNSFNEYMMKLPTTKPTVLNCFNGFLCKNCSMAKQSDPLTEEKNPKGINIYSKCCLELVLNRSESKSPIVLEDTLSREYTNIRSFDCTGPFRMNKNFFEKFDRLLEAFLVNNGLTSLPSLDKLQSLKSLVIEDNKLGFSELVENVKSLNNLTLLRLNNLSYELDKATILKLPPSLEILDLENFKQNTLQFDPKESKLKIIRCSGIKLSPIESTSSNEALSLSKVMSFTKIFTVEQLKEIFRLIHGSKTEYLNSTEAIQFNAFIFNKFPRFGDSQTKTSEKVSKKSAEKDEIGPSHIPEVIFQINTLQELDLSFQAIKNIPNEIENLVNLTKLNLESCVLLTSLSPNLSKLPLSYLNLKGCLSLKTPPPEIQHRGLKAIMVYLKSLSLGSMVCKRTKLMLVGLGEAGKTSLLNALRSDRSKKDKIETEVTDGIEIKEWNVTLHDQTTLTYSMWDFAGQSVYYNTHQFFLTSRAVYILVWNIRLGSEYAGLDFWLSSIKCHAPDAPIFIVGTHIDQVATYSLDAEKLKQRFPQITGFHFVSSHTNEGIDEFSKNLVEVTLQQKYMNEQIPRHWFNFEKSVRDLSSQKSLISYGEVSELAENAGIFDEQEILQAIRFLADLGSLQYFETSGLKDKVVINPQWIIDVMACIVSVKKTFIIEGRLKHSKIAEIWNKYDSDLHEWMLKLTEEFDLTFFVPQLNESIVPCLLPEMEPEHFWPQISTNLKSKVKEYQVIYTFTYIPAGLFNRIQVRLYNYADSSSIWKTGSLLKKNNHMALIKQIDLSIEVKVHGIKPENIIFIIHEVIETLINESFHGIKYDYSFPCPDCISEQFSEPCFFSSGFLRRACDYKAPFIQCNKYFHSISVQEMLSVMPVEGTSTLDLSLGNSLRDLTQMKKGLKYDVLFWYCGKDDVKEQISPVDIIEKIKQNKMYNIWYSKDPGREKINNLTSVIKNSKLVILGVSDKFAQDEKSMQVYELVKKVIKSNYMVVEFGQKGSHKWLESPALAAICSDIRVIMQDPRRVTVKLNEILEGIERNIADTKSDKNLEDDPPDVFISYCWKNSHEAVKKGTAMTDTSLGWMDPRKLVEFFAKNNIKAWIDIENINGSNLFGEITKGLNMAKCVIACLSDEYVNSPNCSLEFRFSHVSLKLPIIKAIVGTGNEWRKNELAFLSSSYSEVNCQYENNVALPTLLSYVQKELEKVKLEKEKTSPKKSEDDIDDSGFQELYELTQRKFLMQINKFCANMSGSLPRLFCIDLVEKHKLDALSDDNVTRMQKSLEMIGKLKVAPPDSNEDQLDSELLPCIRTLCEAEDGWHLSTTIVPLSKNELTTFSSYLSRIMRILKNGNISNQMNIFSTDKGSQLIKDIEEKSLADDKDVYESYIQLRKYFLSFLAKFEKGNEQAGFIELKRCELKNHKILWLCGKHIKALNPTILKDSAKNVSSGNGDEYKLLDELVNVHMNIFSDIQIS